VSLQLSHCHARVALLLQISQTRLGATAVINAGLFHSVKVSGLFATDPDLGVGKSCRHVMHGYLLTISDIDDEDAIAKHYELLAAVMRVICAAVLSRGPQNEQTLDQGRKFLAENRLSILAVLKKSAGLGGGVEIPEQSLDELAEFFMMLISVTGFLDVRNFPLLPLQEFRLTSNSWRNTQTKSDGH
jgi:nuclear pore complex protein Nup205